MTSSVRAKVLKTAIAGLSAVLVFGPLFDAPSIDIMAWMPLFVLAPPVIVAYIWYGMLRTEHEYHNGEIR